MVSFITIFSLIATVFSAPAGDAAEAADVARPPVQGSLVDVDAYANAAELANVDADVNILPYKYGPYGYPHGYPRGYGSLLNADIDLNLLNGYPRGYPHRYPHGYGSLLDADIDLNLLNGYYNGHGHPRYGY